MTAPVITDGITRIPLVPGSNASVNGDRIATLPLVHRAPGQLWERLAESQPVAHSIESARRIQAITDDALAHAHARDRGVTHRVLASGNPLVKSGILRGRSILWGLTSIDDE